MPIYEYECRVCGTRFERHQHFDDPPVSECPEGHQDVRRLFFPAGIVFKGSGWYITDSRNSGKKEQERAKESSTEPSRSSGSDGEN
ncbi:MAG: zinc ribbon domain-containing protein [Ardenticatenia bacterium]|nr:zinc ribbon domain-containing protein [Ardenticatenia bacterium]